MADTDDRGNAILPPGFRAGNSRGAGLAPMRPNTLSGHADAAALPASMKAAGEPPSVARLAQGEPGWPVAVPAQLEAPALDRPR